MVNAMTNWPLRGDSKSFRDFLSRSSFGWWDGFWLEEVQGVGNEDIRKKIKTLHWNVDKASRLWSLLGYFEFVRLSASSKMWCRWGYKYTCLCLLWPSHFPLLIAGLLSHSIFRICSTRVRMTPFGQPLCCSVGYGAGLLSPQGFRHFDDGVFYFCLLFPGLWHQFKEERWGQRKIWCAHIQGFFFFLQDYLHYQGLIFFGINPTALRRLHLGTSEENHCLSSWFHQQETGLLCPLWASPECCMPDCPK